MTANHHRLSGLQEYGTAYGLRFFSDIPLPFLHPATNHSDAPCIAIRMESEREAVDLTSFQNLQYEWSINDRQAWMTIHTNEDGGALFTYSHGQQFAISHQGDITDLSPPTLDIKLRIATMYGPVMSWVCHQFGWMVLHGSSLLDTSNHATVFVAPQRTGKSTLAAFLSQSGWKSFVDDVCVIRKSDSENSATTIPGSNGFEIASGPTHYRLWQDSTDALAFQHHEDLYEGTTKQSAEWKTNDSLPLWAPLKQIMVLQPDEVQFPHTESISGVIALANIASQSRTREWLSGDPLQRHIADIASIVSCTPTYKMWARVGLENLNLLESFLPPSGNLASM
jgi:hypothetical protein